MTPPSLSLIRNTSAPVTADGVHAAAAELFAVRGYRGTTMRDIASALGIQAPGLYNHVASKQDILREIMVGVMKELLDEQRIVVGSTGDLVERVRGCVDAHVRYHCRNQRATFVGNREIPNLEEPSRSLVIAQRDEYEQNLRRLIEQGARDGRFQVVSPQLASFAILEMGIGVAAWYRPDGRFSESAVAHQYGEMALRILGSSASST